MFKVAVVQKPPSLLNREETVKLAVSSIAEASGEGADLVIFPEAFVPGYPTWIWRMEPGDKALAADIHGRLRENAVDLSQDHIQPILDAAAKHGVSIIVGINEVDSDFSGTTLFNTVLIIGPDGRILNRHRKLMPTDAERMVWGLGDASGLRVVDTPVGRLGTLICWESYMPLARYALYAQDIEMLVSPTWDSGESWITAMRHIAKEGGCWVIGTATALQESDIPHDFPARDRLFQSDEWINDGDAVVVDPTGTIMAGPHSREQSILYAEIDIEMARAARRSLDVAGHYSRPDVFSFGVDRRVRKPVDFDDSESS